MDNEIVDRRASSLRKMKVNRADKQDFFSSTLSFLNKRFSFVSQHCVENNTQHCISYSTLLIYLYDFYYIFISHVHTLITQR